MVRSVTYAEADAILKEFRNQGGCAKAEILSRGLGSSESWPVYIEVTYLTGRKHRVNYNLTQLGGNVEKALAALNRVPEPSFGNATRVPAIEEAPKPTPKKPKGKNARD